MILTHVDENGQPRMVDVSEKAPTQREASARAIVDLPAEFPVFAEAERAVTPKGPIFATAIIAGILAVKKTHDLIPFCHPLAIDSCCFQLTAKTSSRLEIICTVKTRAVTGVEMEAIVGASMAAATVYDMCKALTHNILIGPIELIRKSGGKRDVSRC